MSNKSTFTSRNCSSSTRMTTMLFRSVHLYVSTDLLHNRLGSKWQVWRRRVGKSFRLRWTIPWTVPFVKWRRLDATDAYEQYIPHLIYGNDFSLFLWLEPTPVLFLFIFLDFDVCLLSFSLHFESFVIKKFRKYL